MFAAEKQKEKERGPPFGKKLYQRSGQDHRMRKTGTIKREYWSEGLSEVEKELFFQSEKETGTCVFEMETTVVSL